MDAVTLEAFTKRVRGLDDLYEATVRNGFFLPERSTKVICEKYLTMVLDGRAYVPKYSDVRLRPCPCPPKKAILLEKLSSATAKRKLELGFDSDKAPDKRWLIATLSTLNPDDDIFGKAYIPPPVRKEVTKEPIKAIKLPPGFLAGLPATTMNKRLKTLRLKITRNAK